MVVRRVAALLVLGLWLTGCATPEIRLAARFLPGEVRVYRLTDDTDLTVAARGLKTSERLVAVSRIEVIQVSETGATLKLTVTARSLTVDGRRAPPPPEEEVVFEVARDGTISKVTSVGGVPSRPGGPEVEDLVPLVGPPFPPGRTRLTDRWRAELASPEGAPPGIQLARLDALRVVNGFRCAVVSLSTRRPIAGEREIGGTALRLEGIEYGAGEVAFAFREGFPVRVALESEAHLAISGGAAEGGRILLTRSATLTLVSSTRA